MTTALPARTSLDDRGSELPSGPTTKRLLRTELSECCSIGVCAGPADFSLFTADWVAVCSGVIKGFDGVCPGELRIGTITGNGTAGDGFEPTLDTFDDCVSLFVSVDVLL